MSEVKHTPGPWVFYRNDDSDTEMGAIGVKSTVDIAHCDNKVRLTDGYPDPEIEANARLIAAAPDMLEALEWILEECDPYEPVPIKEGLKKAEAAIAKAKGGSSE